MESTNPRAPRILVGGVFLFVAGRAVWWPVILGSGRLLPPHASDEFYHLRRIWYSVVHFPDWIERDAYVGFPNGGEIVWPPGFDWPLAGLARLFGIQDQPALEVFLAWSTPVLGALIVVAAAWLAVRAFSLRAGLLAGLLLAILPGHHNYTQLGMVDHHAAAGLAGTLMLAGAMHVARTRGDGGRWLGLAIALGLGAAAFLSMWPGALLHLALLQALAAIWLLQAADAATARSRAWHLALAFGVAAIAIAPLSLGREWTQYGSVSPLVLSNFQPLWFTATALGAALLALAFGRDSLAASPARRWLLAGGATGLGGALLLLAIPELGTALDYAAGWFRHDEIFQEHVGELRSVTFTLENWGLGGIFGRLTLLLLAFPLVWGWLAYAAVRQRRADWALLAFWALAFGVAASQQARFLNTFCIPYAVILGFGGDRVISGLGAGFAGNRRRAALAVFGLLALAAMAPAVHNFYAYRIAGSLAVLRGEPPEIRVQEAANILYRRVAGFLAEASPPTSGYLDLAQEPEYGVLCDWERGHLVRYLAERPVVQDNFGVYGGREAFEQAQRYYATDSEEEALALLEGLGVRYVIADQKGAGGGATYSPRSMRNRLVQQRGSAGSIRAGRRAQPVQVSALSHHRLVFETPPLAEFGAVRVFEIVPGARIAGRAPAGSPVTASLPMASGPQARFRYQIQATADADGNYELRVPYPTAASGAIRSGAHYAITNGEQDRTLTVSADAVRLGSTLPGPDFD
jgi:dolichyl-diphosphooligosaccharide--protein glycosyltransferase